MLTRWLIFHLASGQSFFTGAACLVVAVWLSAFTARRGVRIARNSLVLLGAGFAFVSATPLPPWFAFGLFNGSWLWLLVEAFRKRLPDRLVLGTRGAVVVAWLGAVAVEAPYHVLPHFPALGHPTLGIIGDSVTAGTGERKVKTWPGLLADRHGVVVRDHAVAGADVASALPQAASVSSDEPLLLLEIGGNDILGSTTAAKFEVGLARLLAAVSRPGRVVVMLELPLPPTYQAFGRIQRRLAQRYHALLVPKRVLLGVLQRPGNTSDTIHLTQAGHQHMAHTLWTVLRPAYSNAPAPLRRELGRP